MLNDSGIDLWDAKKMGVVMKIFSLVICLGIFVLSGSLNAYSSENKGYIQGNPPAASEPSAAPDVNESQTPIHAGKMGYEKTPLNKLERGILNIATFYLEIPASEYRVTKDKDNAFFGATMGTVQGVFTALFRGLTGVLDTVTFLVPPYNKPLMVPEYAVDSLDDAYNYFSS
jgi:putative exosortase-associated protein (TIGR04073 family)